jgi:hypothetical protein
MSEVDVAERHGVRPISAWRDACNDARQARASLRDHDLFESWTVLPDRLETAEQLVAALDTWAAWAQGQPIARRQIVAAIDQLEQHAHRDNSTGAQRLADVVTRWAEHHGIEVNHVHQTRAPVEIELDIGM